MAICSIYSRHGKTRLPVTPFATLLETWARCKHVPSLVFMQMVEDQVSTGTGCSCTQADQACMYQHDILLSA